MSAKFQITDSEISVFPENESGCTFAEIIKPKSLKMEQNFNFLLKGCHALSAVAVAYFPEYLHASSAVRTFRRTIKEYGALQDELTEAGYTPTTTTLTPKQIAIIVRFWGMPTLVADIIEKNPYLATPRMDKKR